MNKKRSMKNVLCKKPFWAIRKRVKIAVAKHMMHIMAAVAIVALSTRLLQAEVVDITEGSTSGYEMTGGNTYVVRNSVDFSNLTPGGSGLSVAPNATVVLYVPKDVTLTAVGANGSGRTGGGAGILVPETATLVITGEGSVNVSGGNAGNGGNGAKGEKGSSISKNGRNVKGVGGKGGVGGAGGGGAGAGIGGSGGTGGVGGGQGSGGFAPGKYNTYAAVTDFVGNGGEGENGSGGKSGSGMGVCYVLGRICLSSESGDSGLCGNAGSYESWTTFSFSYSQTNYYVATCGGGGGGGGGAGSTTTFSIGGGGSSGGGGGGGGGGAAIYEDDSNHSMNPMTNAHGGGGAGGESLLCPGVSGSGMGFTGCGGFYRGHPLIGGAESTRTAHGGHGGVGGAAGAEGSAGTLYVSPTAKVDEDRERLVALTHQAAEYLIDFDANGGEILCGVDKAVATLGCELPNCINTPIRNGYRFAGWIDDYGVRYYDVNGSKLQSCYEITGNLTLHAVWEIDQDKTVVPGSTFWVRENAEVGWIVDVESEVGGKEILRSGAIGSNTNSWMETTIVGPACFSFDWRVSCNTRGHYLSWSIDGVEQARIKGDTDWTMVSASIGEGRHLIRFDYVKGSTGAVGEDKGQVRNFNLDPVRIETESMQVLWDWTTNYWVQVSATGLGTADFDAGWITDGSNLVVNLKPTVHSYKVVLSGDTNDVVCGGTRLEIPIKGASRIINVAIDEVRPRLVVVSSQGVSDPSVGEHEYPSDAEVIASATAPDPASGVRATCTGWTGTGSVPVSGVGNRTLFCITNDSSITWNWTTEYWVEFSVVGDGATSFVDCWVPEGAELKIPFTVNTPFYSLALSGNADGAGLDGSNVTVVVNGPRSIVLTVAEWTYKDALDEEGLEWTSSGASVWSVQKDVSHDGIDAVRSGAVSGDDVSVLSTIVSGAGTLSWWWMLDMSECAGVDVFVDDDPVAYLEDAGEWVQESVEIIGEGVHSVRFEFWNAGMTDALSDCAWLDDVVLISHPMHSITFDSCGGSEIPATMLRKDCAYGCLPTPIRDGCLFRGWYTQPHGGELIMPETIVDSDRTLYAHWRGISDIKVFSGSPWQEIVIGYTIVGSASGPIGLRTIVSDNDTGGTWTNETYEAEALAEGRHQFKWNEAKVCSANLEVKLQFFEPTYCVIDLSGGATASSYPVTYLSAIPNGGWTDEYKTTKIVLRRIEAGSFIMGDDQTDEGHRVTLTKPFYMGVFEVTQKQWTLVMGSNPCASTSYGKGDVYPVHYISYDTIRGNSNGSKWPTSSAVDETSFMGRIQIRTGLSFDLPSEAQWEYSCRAGTAAKYYWGTSMNGDYLWCASNSGNKAHPVGSKKPNDWGLCDMCGNVWELNLDWLEALCYGMDPKGASEGTKRVIRGGCWSDGESTFVASYRNSRNPASTSAAIGFRLSLALQSGAEAFVEATSSLISADTAFVDGANVNAVLPFPIAYGNVVSSGCTVAADEVELLASMESGVLKWRPNALGEYSLVWTSGGLSMTTKVNVIQLLVVPTIVGDEGATVMGDAETGFVIKPSEGNTAVEVTIPQGVDAAKVTVEVSPKVASVKPNGAKVKIVSRGVDITEFLNIPAADGNGVVDLAKATVKEEIVKEVLDVEKGAKIVLDAVNPSLTTPNTRVGLFYQLREGATLDGMSNGDSTIGDGNPWKPDIKVKGGNSAFYSIGVGKGE